MNCEREKIISLFFSGTFFEIGNELRIQNKIYIPISGYGYSYGDGYGDGYVITISTLKS